LRQGRYDRGPKLNAGWFAEAVELTAVLETIKPRGRNLQLACGTDIWTDRLLPFADELTAVDAPPEVIALNAARRRALATVSTPKICKKCSTRIGPLRVKFGSEMRCQPLSDQVPASDRPAKFVDYSKHIRYQGV